VELQKFPPSVTVIIMEASVVSVMDIMEAALVMGIMGEEGRKHTRVDFILRNKLINDFLILR